MQNFPQCIIILRGHFCIAKTAYAKMSPCIILRGHFCIEKTAYAKLSPMYYTEGTLLHSKNSLYKTVPPPMYYIEGTLLHSRNSLFKTVLPCIIQQKQFIQNCPPCIILRGIILRGHFCIAKIVYTKLSPHVLY